MMPITTAVLVQIYIWLPVRQSVPKLRQLKQKSVAGLPIISESLIAPVIQQVLNHLAPSAHILDSKEDCTGFSVVDF